MTPDPTRKLADLAKAEADALGHGAISTEHFLLALATDPSCGAMTLLSRFGATADAIRAAVITLAPSGHATPRARLPFTPDAKRVLEAALNAATALATQRIESTHVLLGLTSTADFTSARALASMGLDLAVHDAHCRACVPGESDCARWMHRLCRRRGPGSRRTWLEP